MAKILNNKKGVKRDMKSKEKFSITVAQLFNLTMLLAFMLIIIALMHSISTKVISNKKEAAANDIQTPVHQMEYIPQQDFYMEEQSSTVAEPLVNYAETELVKIAFIHPDSIALNGKVTVDTDLLNRQVISEDDMQKCIDFFTRGYPNSAFVGTAEAFIQASLNTGYDPIFLFSLAGLESGWNTSSIHRERCNPYSIAMYDNNIYAGAVLGSNFSEGIVNGAQVIYELWYANGQKTLAEMQDPSHIYATNASWASIIAEIMNQCYEIINK